MAMVVCTQSSANHPSNGLPSAMRRDSGCTQGLLTSLSSTKTNFTTTQVSQIGSRVSSPVSRVFLKPCRGGALCGRSEEHTSELQSLMRISYAVFCLKKKMNKKYASQE